MDIAAVMDEIGDALATIDGLRVFPYYADKVTPPSAVVHWPDSYEFDQTMQRGSDLVTVPVTVVVGRADARTSRDRLAQYVKGSGATSVKAAVEQHEPASFESARVKSVEFGAFTIANSTYLGATFDIEIYAPGEVA